MQRQDTKKMMKSLAWFSLLMIILYGYTWFIVEINQQSNKKKPATFGLITGSQKPAYAPWAK